jgi:hypothetical protein
VTFPAAGGVKDSNTFAGDGSWQQCYEGNAFVEQVPFGGLRPPLGVRQTSRLPRRGNGEADSYDFSCFSACGFQILTVAIRYHGRPCMPCRIEWDVSAGIFCTKLVEVGTMRMNRLLCCSAITWACAGLLIPRLAVASGPAPTVARQAAQDIALADGGVLQGQVIDTANVAVPGCEVVLIKDGQEVARTRTDPEGRFALSGLRGGVYQVLASGGGGLYRLWSPRTAPPAARANAMVVTGPVVRGQWGGGQALNLLSNPWVVAGAATAGIAIPIALDDGSSS